jgi:hypothetical protein
VGSTGREEGAAGSAGGRFKRKGGEREGREGQKRVMLRQINHFVSLINLPEQPGSQTNKQSSTRWPKAQADSRVSLRIVRYGDPLSSLSDWIRFSSLLVERPQAARKLLNPFS